jgi:hypothetical protein
MTDVPLLTIRDSTGASAMRHPAITRTMAGTTVIVMRASFHWTAIATMYAEKKSEMPWARVYNFSAMPWLTRLPSRRVIQ